jgi:phosphoglucomutase
MAYLRLPGPLPETAGTGKDPGVHFQETPSGWFAARPSGTEQIYKLYVESLKSAEHLAQIIEQAQAIVSRSIA